MKTAHSPNGRPLVASEHAPARAFCPQCGGNVTLRHRRRMGGGVAYYWRHRSNANPTCRARTHPLR